MAGSHITQDGNLRITQGGNLRITQGGMAVSGIIRFGIFTYSKGCQAPYNTRWQFHV